MPDLVDEKRAEIEDRRKELAPLVDEYHVLEAALQALDGAADAPAPTRRRGPGRPPGSKRARRAPQWQAKRTVARGRATAGDRADHPRRGSRKDQLLAEIAADPGLTVAEYATRSGIDPSYAHALVDRLKSDGNVRRDGPRVYPTTNFAS